MHKRPVCRRRFLCQAHVRKLYSFQYIKDVVLSKDIYIRILSDGCSGFHTPNTWLQARVSVSGYCQAVIQVLCIKESTILHLSASKN